MKNPNAHIFAIYGDEHENQQAAVGLVDLAWSHGWQIDAYRVPLGQGPRATDSPMKAPAFISLNHPDAAQEFDEDGVRRLAISGSESEGYVLHVDGDPLDRECSWPDVLAYVSNWLNDLNRIWTARPNPVEDAVSAGYSIRQNPLTTANAATLLEEYKTNRAQLGDAVASRAMSDLSHALERATLGYNHFLRVSVEWERESVGLGVPSGTLFSEMAYHARAIYGELWTVRENARHGAHGREFPGFASFDPEGLKLVRNNVILHRHKVPERGQGAGDHYSAWIGPRFSTQTRLRNNEEWADPGLFVNTVEFVEAYRVAISSLSS